MAKPKYVIIYFFAFEFVGFVKEQLRITSVYNPRVIWIRGERPVLNNKKSRFKQEITVPPKCDLNNIHAKFQNSILTIKIPKDVPPKLLTSDEELQTIPEKTPSSTSKAPADQPPKPTLTNQTERQKVDQKTISDQQQAQKSKEEETVQKAKAGAKSDKVSSSKQETPSTSKVPEQPKPRTVQDSSVLPKHTPITVGSDKQKDEKSSIVSSIAQKPSPDLPQIQKEPHEVVVQKPMTEPNFQTVDEKLGEAKADEKGKAIERTLQEEKEREYEKGKESSVSADHQKGEEINNKESGGLIEEKPKEKCEWATKYTLGMKNVNETAKEALNNVPKTVNDEEMQLLVNVGVAALVLVGFGVYISSSFGTSGQNHK